MKKKLSVIIAIMLTFALSFAFAACDEEPKEQFGTLTIENVTLVEGTEAQLNAVFSDASKAEEITYSFDGNAIEIKNGVVKALSGGVTVSVTAKTEHHEATFTVTTLIDYGTLTVENVNLAVGDEKTINAVFSNPERAEEITYAFEGNAIEIKDGKVKALQGGQIVTVTAATEHLQATFTVTTQYDYGTLTVSDVEGAMEGAKGITIEYTFSNPDFSEPIEYSFEGNDIEIVNGRINVLVGGKTIVVTAKTEHHETTFTVTTLIDYGTLTVEDVIAWVGYPASELDFAFSKSEYAEQLTYEYDATALTIDAAKNTVTALKAGEFEVLAKSEHFADRFKVKAETVNKSDSRYNVSADNDNRIAGKLSVYNNAGNDGKTTLFIGDSFFDERWFWTNFDQTYAGKDAIIAGVSGSTSYDWEHFTETFLKFVSPKQVAMHMGTNNVYDDNDTAAQAISALQRMFYVMHQAMPETHIYWFNISQRSYDPDKIAIVSSVNSQMTKWANGRTWLTVIDTSSKLTNDMLKDNVHPKLEHYDVFVDALKDAGAVIEDATEKEIVGFTAGQYDKENKTFSLKTNARTRAYLMDGTTAYCGNFAVSGTAKSSANGGNPWTEFIVNKTPADDWFSAANALPVSNITFASNGDSAIWGYKADGSRDTLATVDVNSYAFAVIAYNGSILFKVNDSVKVYSDTDFKNTYFGFGAENAELAITNLSIVISNDAAVRAKYDELAPTPSDSIDDIVRTVDQSIGNKSWTAEYKGKLLNRNYVISGKLDVTDKGGNAHVHFKFDGDGNRILLWDAENDGYLKLRCSLGNEYGALGAVPDNAKYQKKAGETLTLTWKLVVTDADAYFYVNDALRLVWKNIPGNSLNISTENVAGKIYDMSAKTSADDSQEYAAVIAGMQSTIDAYKTNAAGVYRA
ncbi:MAG: SGNH/GDSL hydrolase family protein [Candidatus Neoclostridium sp.]